jgi:hypothetical protein
MRIVFDGREVERLDPKVARKISLAADTPVVEGSVLAADPIIAAAGRRSRIGLGIVGGIVAAILIGVAILTLSYEPADMVFIGPLYLVILMAMGWGGPAIYRQSLSRMRDTIVPRLARMAPAGTAVRLDAAGLTVGGRTTPWSAVTIEAVEVVTQHDPDGDDGYTVEAVVLEAGGQPVVLDRGVMTNGPLLVDKALRTLGVAFR